MAIRTLSDVEYANKRVLLRADLNVPFLDGKISSEARIEATIPTIKALLSQKAKVMIVSHLGRPTADNKQATSLAPVAKALSQHLDQKVTLISDLYTPLNLNQNNVVLFENIRWHPGETANDQALSQHLASLCDVFVMDAFGTIHRKHASTYGVTQYAKHSCVGPLIEKELHAAN